jgi:ParB family chromosome partitioning protein
MTSGDFHSVFIDQITVLPRHRKKMGSIEELAQSIASLGVLLQPIVITRDNVLRAGERRLRACKSLGWTHIPCHYIDELDEVKLKRIELEENIKRKGME